MNQQCENFYRVMHDWKRVFCKMKPHSIPQSEFFTLVNISDMLDKQTERKDGVKVSDLVIRLHTSKPAISKKLKFLEEKELIVRTIDKNDKRVMLVTPTEAGYEVIKKEKEAMDTLISKVLKEMGTEDTKQFLGLCKKLQDIMLSEI